jgi:mRNA-degrading endonuclease RelE of RelBE toxin-antitoxin system
VKRLVLEDREAAAFLRDLAPQPRKALRQALEKLRDDPTGKRHGLDVKRLRGGHAVGLARLRGGQQRVIFAVKGNLIRVTRIMHREAGYERLQDE